MNVEQKQFQGRKETLVEEPYFFLNKGNGIQRRKVACVKSHSKFMVRRKETKNGKERKEHKTTKSQKSKEFSQELTWEGWQNWPGPLLSSENAAVPLELGRGDPCWTIISCSVIFPRVPIRKQSSTPFCSQCSPVLSTHASFSPGQCPARRNQGPHLIHLLLSLHFTKSSYEPPPPTKKTSRLLYIRDPNQCKDLKNIRSQKQFRRLLQH